MKTKQSFLQLLAELMVAAAISLLLSYFAQSFFLWFSIALVLLLGWHQDNEIKLVRALNPKEQKASIWDGFSQTIAYYRSQNRQEKIKALRLLSKLNKNIQYLPNAIMICEKSGDILWCNNASQELFSFYWNKKAQKNIFNIIFYPEFQNYFNQTQHPRPLVLVTNIQQYLEINITPYDDDTFMVIARDITQMIRVMQWRQTFLANMNHELRTPLTVLQGYVEILAEDDNGSPVQQKAVQAMQQQCHRMTNLLNDLTTLAKIEMSNNVQHHKVNLSELIKSLEKNTALLNQYNQQIIFDIEPKLIVRGDEGQLQSAVSNLIYNAIKHAGENSKISISWQREQDKGIFAVQDNGVGIAEQHLAHLTERFYRVDESRSNKTGGSGLGLAIVKHALEHHGSKLNIESEIGQGSRFWFEIKLENINSESA
ncbi:two-component system phosphate regulon sensor histidine kinase PhoR [Cricetibacter osteomyelitidis]|uniref:Phosphate regulon sensor protein PhoR n=1 Tax=Cricetibacter osteomyelitidis TaxID=1521931 RepID=A0A4R2SY31_9PAST|nr:phosphate regulon sensor histidine kinase PhoR [Cricetibacter osteomyelitidis]TCP93384.1 two-component system phosphate regulon sensor histidine kinase PhoR [Cricetibacter osteomyelitidis]